MQELLLIHLQNLLVILLLRILLLIHVHNLIRTNFNGNYIVKFTIEHDDDIDLSNNELSVVTCTKENVGVLEIEEQLWTLGQNIPNPAQTMTEIPYAIPVDGMVNVKIMSVSGQVLYQKRHKLQPAITVLCWILTSYQWYLLQHGICR